MKNIAGNHDLAVHREWYAGNWKSRPRRRATGKVSAEAILDFLKGPRAIAAGAVYLQDEEYTFLVHEGGKEWSVYGSPFQVGFRGRLANLIGRRYTDPVLRLGVPIRKTGCRSIRIVNPQTDILLTHSPPHHILDLNGATPPTPSGCPAFAARLCTGALRSRLHVFGHIHEARGAYVHLWDREGDHDLGPQNTSQLHVRGILQEDGVKSERAPPVETLPLGRPWPNRLRQRSELAPRGGRKVPVGGPGVEPVVVDFWKRDWVFVNCLY
ncbi:hypothetical protein B0H14DRAFT_3148594 [Mycena olivaceomarginata]|nr:hypothetical protein B0H14DRAFT_3148594 [Mycena olivaceomarginata]